ncbi:MAG: DUF3179 domain-containing protein [Calditrichia bacterium]
MKTILYFKILSAIILVTFSCSNSVETSTGSIQGDWLIPSNKVVDGGPGRDGIPSIDHPKFITVDQVDFLDDPDLIILVKQNNIIHGYPHRILDWHEIVNDQINDTYFSVTYCPLTGTALVWNRKFDDQVTTFGVSGLLYNSNLIPYDRNTQSNWSQMKILCVNGPLIGERPQQLPMIETTWATAKVLFPEMEVLSTDTGYDRNYFRYPYGNYKFTDQLLFDVEVNDNRLPKKERVFGVIGNIRTVIFRGTDFEGVIELIEINIDDQRVLVAGSNLHNFAMAFTIPEQDSLLTFTTTEKPMPALFKDNRNNTYNIFGEIIEGPEENNQLEFHSSYMGYWFAWPSFWNNIQFYSPAINYFD